jgi:SAM-dependent methyltransferase
MNEEIRRTWNSVASAWDKYRARISQNEAAVTQRMLDAIDAHRGDTILELTAGPGDVGLMLARRHPGARVLITDFAPRMVEVAARTAKELGLDNVEVREMDAQAIDLKDESVDGVLSRYGLMIVPERERAFAEIRRVLRRGCTLAYAVWGPMQTNPWMTIFGGALVQLGHFQPPEDEPMSLSSIDDNRATLAAAGFDDVDGEEIDVPFEFDSFDEYWEMSSQIGGPLAEIYAGLDAEQRSAVRDTVQLFAESFRTGDGLTFPSKRIFVRAS